MEDFTEPLGALRVRLNEADKYFGDVVFLVGS